MWILQNWDFQFLSSFSLNSRCFLTRINNVKKDYINIPSNSINWNIVRRNNLKILKNSKRVFFNPFLNSINWHSIPRVPFIFLVKNLKLPFNRSIQAFRFSSSMSVKHFLRIHSLKIISTIIIIYIIYICIHILIQVRVIQDLKIFSRWQIHMFGCAGDKRGGSNRLQGSVILISRSTYIPSGSSSASRTNASPLPYPMGM